ncbi:AmmeMemoRadiSam system protein B [Thiomicrorhabdus sp. ZW0627]|uniref:AmmeMemoRadiSam system protein B n=1 Tax=Thiomicrorhabdus sp. ZW0627 TaxID=3039774 RepID=UPI002436F5B0|nr:AmmeMemoRadiSam system protein B [Thiomicrorhabdus sp. ZW0627]MDG6773026.1 AmmeMemoRadiSam system protein B [Thiomicrorhabdus sp. ZW0627]
MILSNDIRQTAVAGLFYPQQPELLLTMFKEWMPDEDMQSSNSEIPRALIVPHAGYVYSGEAAARGYKLWMGAEDQIKTVVVMGPAHRVGFHGITTLDFDAVDSPLGPLEIDTQLRDELLETFPQIEVSNFAQKQEHSLEVHFPFLKYLLPDVKVLPLLNGSVSVDQVKQVLENLWQRKDVYFVISSDLSHFHPYDEARTIDSQTAEMVNQANWLPLNGERACGYKGIQGLLALHDEFSMQIQEVGLVNSGDTAGDKSRVVGYGTWAIYRGKS